MISKEHILLLIKNAVMATEPDAKVILYGSYARGDFNNDSDIDIIVLLNKEKISMADRKKVSSILFKIELEIGIVISPFLYTMHDWELKPRITPFYENVSREGILL